MPYFIFGDRAPLIGCIDELDKAFNWAEKYGLTILIDLHTAPMSQNGFDNGGISGVCKWAQLPDEVEFVLSVLERLAKRYGHRRALMGIEIINEPNTTTSWPMMNVTERYKAVDPELAEGVYGQINVYGVTTKSERHKRSYWTRTADGNGIGGRKAPVPYGS